MPNATRREFLKYGGALGAALGAGSLPRIAAAQEVLKVGVVYVSPVAEIGWTKQHSLGAQGTAIFEKFTSCRVRHVVHLCLFSG